MAYDLLEDSEGVCMDPNRTGVHVGPFLTWLAVIRDGPDPSSFTDFPL